MSSKDFHRKTAGVINGHDEFISYADGSLPDDAKPTYGVKHKIPYKLVNGYPKIEVGYHNIEVVEKYIIHSSNVAQFARESFPRDFNSNPPPQTSGSLPKWTRDVSQEKNRGKGELPRAMPAFRLSDYKDQLRTRDVSFEPLHPDLPGDPLRAHLHLVDAYGEPIPTGTTVNVGELELDEALVDPTWVKTYQDYYIATIVYDVYQGRFTHRMTAGGTFVSAPSDTDLFYASEINGVNHETGTDSDDWDFSRTHVLKDKQLAIYRSRPTIQHVIGWDYIVAPNFTEINKHLGKVNSTIFELINLAKPETCLFMGYRGRKLNLFQDAVLAPDGSRLSRDEILPVYELELSFTEMTITNTETLTVIDYDGNVVESEVDKTYGWNHQYVYSKDKWMYVTAGDQKKPLYESYNFQEVLRFWPGVKEATDVYRELDSFAE